MQVQRRLQDAATNISWWQSGQRPRAKRWHNESTKTPKKGKSMVGGKTLLPVFFGLWSFRGFVIPYYFVLKRANRGPRGGIIVADFPPLIP